MQTETKTVTQLPIMKYFDDAKLVERGKESLAKWRKGEKPIGAILGLIVIAVIAYGTFKWIIPAVFGALSQVLAVIASILAVVLVILLLPAIFKLFRRIVRSFHKAIIRWNPFDELEEQKQKMWQTHDMFLTHKAKIKQLRTDFEQMSKGTQKVAEDAKTEVQHQTKKASEIKKQMEKMVEEKGEAIKETDEYVDLQQQFINATSGGTRSNTILEKNIEWTTKYAARSNIFANLDRKLAIGATLLENKIKDFEESINIMKKDWEMAAASRGATAILKEILGPGGQNWKLEYALEFVAGRISEDLAMTAQNLEDLEKNTTAFDFDSDEAYEKLLAIGNKLDAGQIDVPSPSKISNPNHKLTHEEKSAAGPLGDIF
ncbi:MAG TPA: hypothetical protein VK179_07330 [Bacteroidales bacterium]|nr:hypothetical protein [Bacteroidales bacterium]